MKLRIPSAALAAAISLAAAALAPSPAGATIISLDFDLKASGFGAGASIDPVVGNFQITFDNAANIFLTGFGMVVTDFNLPFQGYYAYNATLDRLFVGTLPDPGSADVYGNGGYGFDVLNASGAYSGGFFRYGIFDPTGKANEATIYPATEFTVTPTTASLGVPEPSAWALMLVGFGALGGLLRRRRALAAA